jgi:cysteine synthase A
MIPPSSHHILVCAVVSNRISGGASMWAAVETAKNAPEGSVIVAMLADTGERYLSTPLYADIAADMNEEELEIARSTPSWILDP